MSTRAPLLPVAAALALAAVHGAAVAQDVDWLDEGRCRLATDALPAAYGRCGTLEVPLESVVTTIKELLETRVRPAVAQDGGDITFQGYHDGIVFLNMKGSCSGCPSSTATLKHGIENLLRHFIPEVTEVRPV